MDANPDIAYDSFEETAHPRGPGGRWSDKPGMGNKTKSLPWWQRGEKPEQPKQSASKEAMPGTGGQGGEPQYKKSVEIIKSMSKGALPPDQRVYKGKMVETKNKLTKLQSRDIAEAGVMRLLQQHGLTDAKQANIDKPNYPVDLMADHLVIECKGGLVSNNEKSHRWTASIGEPGKEEKAALAAMTPEEKNAHNRGKNQDIIARKMKAMADYEKELGEPVKGMTVTTIINPDTKTFDVYAFEGFHLKVNWRSPEATKAFIGTFKYE